MPGWDNSVLPDVETSTQVMIHHQISFNNLKFILPPTILGGVAFEQPGKQIHPGISAVHFHAPHLPVDVPLILGDIINVR
jgi:hypothetical protein